MVSTGKSFIGTPYVGKTLEIGDEESLVINLRELDCTTFVETCLALAKTAKSGKASFGDYTNTLKNIRYRNGILSGYGSRLHYFTDWIADNQQKGFVTDITKKLGGEPFPVSPTFMSTHPAYYRQLANDSCLIEQIRHYENEIAKRSYFYIPKEKVTQIEPELKDGMIVGITTNIEGLEIIHTGILIKENGRIHLLHASSDFKQVMITEHPLIDYLNGNKRQTGIMVLEPR
jgi:hypothetical protein